jgi:glucose-1-phosphate adenylyltransferase
MDFREILATHRSKRKAGRADVTIGAVLVSKERSRDLGILRVDRDGNVTAFVEKPGADESRYTGLEAPPELLAGFGVDPASGPWFLGNMGIYVFDLGVLEDALDNPFVDFGREVLPSLLGKRQFRAHLFQGYWEDIGTVRAFHEANLELLRELPRFNLFNPEWPIYTRARHLPASKLPNVRAVRTAIADGCIVDDSDLEDTLLGIRSVVKKGCVLKRTYVMGADFYETDEDRERNLVDGLPDLGIGEGSRIENAIVDKNCRIGRRVRLVNTDRLETFVDPQKRVYIRDGVIVVPREGVIPDGFEI